VINAIKFTEVDEVDCYIYSTDLLLPELLGYALANTVIAANRINADLEEWRNVVIAGSNNWLLTSNRLLLRQGCLVVPDQDQLRIKILNELYTRLVYAYSRRNKMRRIVQT